MAIKPNDCIVPYGKLVRWVRTGRSVWDTKREYDEKYLENFDDHVYDLVRKQNIDAEIIRGDELKKFGATYRPNRTNYEKTYIKFRTHADLTFFILRWA